MPIVSWFGDKLHALFFQRGGFGRNILGQKLGGWDAVCSQCCCVSLGCGVSIWLEQKLRATIWIGDRKPPVVLIFDAIFDYETELIYVEIVGFLKVINKY